MSHTVPEDLRGELVSKEQDQLSTTYVMHDKPSVILPHAVTVPVTGLGGNTSVTITKSEFTPLYKSMPLFMCIVIETDTLFKARAGVFSSLYC